MPKKNTRLRECQENPSKTLGDCRPRNRAGTTSVGDSCATSTLTCQNKKSQSLNQIADLVTGSGLFVDIFTSVLQPLQ